MTAAELDKMVNAMRTNYHTVDSRMEITNAIYYLIKGLRAIGRKDLVEQLTDLYEEIDTIETSEIVKIGTFR